MKIFDVIIEMEKDGELFYRNLANHAPNKGFQTIFNQLADDEVAHQKVFSDLKSVLPIAYPDVEMEKDLNIFRQFQKENPHPELDTDPATSQLNLYQKALETEKKSQELYLNEAAAENDPVVKSLLERIAKEEEQHYLLMHNLVELMLRPQTWVENGEFVHLDEY